MKQILLLILLFFSVSYINGKQCKALVFEDSDDLGGFQAGAFKALAYNLAADQVDYDVITGVGMGAINGAGVSMFAKGQEKQAADWLYSLWSNIKQKNVYKPWFGGLVQGLLFQKGIYNTQPLREFLTSKINQSIKRKFSFGATDVDTCDFYNFNETLSHSNLIEALMASFAVPVNFPYINLFGHTFFTGSIAFSINVFDAVNRCLEIATDESEITIDIIFTSTQKLTPWPQNPKMKPLDSFNRYNKLASLENSYVDFYEAKDYYQKVNWRYLISPSQSLPDSNFPFLFDQDQTKDLLNKGYADALAVIQNKEEAAKTLENGYYYRLLKKYQQNITEENIQKLKDIHKKREESYQKLLEELNINNK